MNTVKEKAISSDVMLDKFVCILLSDINASNLNGVTKAHLNQIISVWKEIKEREIC